MTILYQITSIYNGYAITDDSGNPIPETATYSDIDWARIDLMKMAADYYFKQKENAEENCEAMQFNKMEIADDKVVLK